MPLGRGVYHVLRPGETLWRLSRTYGVELDELIRVNHIADPRDLRVGTKVFIPGARHALYPPLPPVSPPGREKRRSPVPSHRPKVARESLPRVGGLEFSWPLRGRISRYFSRDSGGRHDGIDIAVPEGTLVRAAEGGEVIFSDWGPGGYGRAVIIRHPGDFHTVYAHNRKLLVRKGDKVARGQSIARSGQTGRATGPH
ncbi:MAG: peptidoglycan DD-metalloendopeptidase family protein, partial [Nitrospinota bacterium]